MYVGGTCLSNAFTRPSNFLLFLQLMRTCVLFLTDCVNTLSGPVLNSSCSLWANSSGVISLFGLFIVDLEFVNKWINCENTRSFSWEKTYSLYSLWLSGYYYVWAIISAQRTHSHEPINIVQRDRKQKSSLNLTLWTIFTWGSCIILHSNELMLGIIASLIIYFRVIPIGTELK